MGISRKNSELDDQSGSNQKSSPTGQLDIELKAGSSGDTLSLAGFTLPLHARAGFTLLEVLIAVILFTVGTIALIAALNCGIFSVSDVEGTRLALNIAQANMELITSKSFTDIDTDAEISNLVSNLGFSDFTVSGNVAEGQNPMQADITVGWNVKGGVTSFTLTTLIADYSTQ